MSKQLIDRLKLDLKGNGSGLKAFGSASTYVSSVATLNSVENFDTGLDEVSTTTTIVESKHQVITINGSGLGGISSRK